MASQRRRVSEEASRAEAPMSTVGSSHGLAAESPLDMDVTVLAFAQWVSEMKARQGNSQHTMQAEMSMIRNAITSNHGDLTDFKRHGAAIQQQMQSETNEIRESLSSVFMEITSAVRNNAAADQDIKLKIQSLNEQAVRNETAFAQLADAADQSQSKLRNAVTEMQLSSERMRDELATLNRQAEGLETAVGDRAERISADTDQLTQELHVQLERRKEHLKKLVNDVVQIGEALQNLVTDFSEQKRGAGDMSNKMQSSLYVMDQNLRKETSSAAARGLATTAESLQAGARYAGQAAFPSQAFAGQAAFPSQAYVGQAQPGYAAQPGQRPHYAQAQQGVPMPSAAYPMQMGNVVYR